MAKAKALNIVKPRTESVQVKLLEAIRHSILSGEVRPGDLVSEIHLARANDVSQTTVREALVKLEHAGLVRRIHNVGTFVTQMSPREIQERLRLRVMLEGLAAMEAARLISPRQFADMEQRTDAIAQAVARGGYYEVAQADLEFHRAIWRSSGDNTLYAMLDQLTVPLFAFVSLERMRMQERLSDQVVRVHEPIVRALRKHEPGAAQEAMRVHIETSYSEFLGSAQSYKLAAR
jgi:DNA-binding GntR family transcriptional regulator